MERALAALVKLALGGVVAAVCGEATFPRDEKNKAVAKAIAPRLTAAMNQRCRVESEKCSLPGGIRKMFGVKWLVIEISFDISGQLGHRRVSLCRIGSHCF